MKKNKGFTLVLTFWLIAIILLLITSLTLAINNRINFVGKYENKLKATYFAEAGIEEAYAKIKLNSAVSLEELKNITGYNGKYIITDVNKYSDPDFFQIKARGESNGAISIITTEIILGQAGETVKAGGEIYKEYKNFETVIDGGLLEGASIDSLDKDDLEDYFKNYSENERLKYNEDKSVNIQENPTFFNDWVNEGYKVMFVDGDLTIGRQGAGGKKSSIGMEDSPFIIMTTGNINIQNVSDIESIIFVTLGDFIYNKPDAHVTFDNTFIYAGKNIEFYKDSGNPALNTHFKYSGRMIAQNNITIFSKGGEVNQEKVDLDIDYFLNGINENSGPIITKWQES